ncbi:MAG: hypothetical protein R2810_05075 [Flavobacteriales bacterium]
MSDTKAYPAVKVGVSSTMAAISPRQQLLQLRASAPPSHPIPAACTTWCAAWWPNREGTKPNLCHIIDAHFFRGRFSAREANEKPNQLATTTASSDGCSCTTTYRRTTCRGVQGRKKEKGIDVLMAL